MTMTRLAARPLGYQDQNEVWSGIGPAAPTTGSYNLHDKMLNSAPGTGKPLGWVCVAAGTPGTWRPFGLLGTETIRGGVHGVVGNAARVLAAVASYPLTFPAGLPGSYALATTADEAERVFTIKKLTAAGVASNVGTLTFAADSKVGVFALASAVTLAAGEGLVIDAPAATLTTANLAIALVAELA